MRTLFQGIRSIFVCDNADVEDCFRLHDGRQARFFDDTIIISVDQFPISPIDIIDFRPVLKVLTNDKFHILYTRQ